jgi:hypothetical protein
MQTCGVNTFGQISNRGGRVDTGELVVARLDTFSPQRSVFLGSCSLRKKKKKKMKKFEETT